MNDLARIAALSLLLSPPMLLAALADPPNFQDDILPILREHCLACHNADKAEADLNLSTLADIADGSSGGKVVVAGSPGKSSLFLAVSHDENVAAMPPESPRIAAAQITRIGEWIAGGLLNSAGGKSQLRDVSFAAAAGSMARPADPAFPKSLPQVPIAKTNTKPPVIALAASPWAGVIAASGYRQVLLYGAADVDRRPYELLGALAMPEGDVYDLRFSPNGTVLIAAGGTGARSGKVRLFDVSTGKTLATLADEFDVVLSADISADHKRVAIGTPARVVKIFDTQTGQLLHKLTKHTDWVTAVRFSPDGKRLATADRNGGVYVWETDSAGIVFALDQHKVQVNALAWRGDGRLLASVAEDGKIVLWDINDGWALRTITAHAQPSANRYSRRTGVMDIDIAPDGRLLTVGRDRTVRLWKPDGQRIAESKVLLNLPLSASFLVGDTAVVVGDFDGQLHYLDLPQLMPLQQASSR